MRRLRIVSAVPLAALTVVLGVVAVAILADPPLDFPFSEPPEGAPIPNIELSLGDHDLTGVVLGPGGDPVDGAGVSLKEGARPAWTWTAADGSFTLTDLDAGSKRVLVTALGLQATAFDVELDPARAEPHVLRLERRIVEPEVVDGLALQDLVGRVALGDEADPEGGHELLLRPLTAPFELSGGFPRRASVGPDGRFEVRLLHEGEYRVILLGPEDLGGQGPDLLSTGPEDVVTLRHGADGATGEVRLRSRAGSLFGGVRQLDEEAGPLGRPVRGALVRVEPIAEEDGRASTVLRADDFRATRTDREGRYRVRDLRPGRYRVTVVAGRARRQSDIVVPPEAPVEASFETTR